MRNRLNPICLVIDLTAPDRPHEPHSSLSMYRSPSPQVVEVGVMVDHASGYGLGTGLAGLGIGGQDLVPGLSWEIGTAFPLARRTSVPGVKLFPPLRRTHDAASPGISIQRWIVDWLEIFTAFWTNFALEANPS